MEFPRIKISTDRQLKKPMIMDIFSSKTLKIKSTIRKPSTYFIKKMALIGHPLKCYYRPTASLQLNNKRNTKYNITVT